ncbi:hypothetical protein ABEW34_28335 [Paenibacillus algorifonticola]|uniref:HD domain-containing protein n=1 Tax=Paenibacillus algorifonticola TaxID=684063 RepID=UPI003D2A1773
MLLKTRYTLERHLKAHCINDQNYQILLEAYQFNKHQICEVLESVKLHFPHFSKHGVSHSACIVSSIELLLGEERIESLSASDTFLILLAAYLHDIGMYLTNSEIRQAWMTKEFVSFLEDFAEIDDSAAFVKQFYAGINQSHLNHHEYILDLVEHVRIVYAEYFRRSHGEKGAERIRKNLKDLDIFVDAGQFIPKRIVRLLSIICSSHNDEFLDLLNNLPYKQSSSLGDMIHPRFIAVMLRIGDLMDMDNNRFDELAINSTGISLNEISRTHYDKHNSVEELLITPELIEVVSVSEDTNVRLEALRWMRWIEHEIDNLRQHWYEIVPNDLSGTVPKFKYQVKRRNSELPFEDKDLKLEFPPEKAFDIIIGRHIYNDRFIFLRELVQNSLDSLKRQLWRDFSRNFNLSSHNGNFSYHFAEETLAAYQVKIFFYDTAKKNNGAEQLIEHIGLKLFNNLMQGTAQTSRNENKELFVVIEDNGTGISVKDFENRILKVGKKTDKNSAYIKETKNMPQWLQPTGNFGIGLHSVFQVTDQIVIQTRSELDQELGREIIIQSGKKGGYVSSDKWDYTAEGRGKALNRGARIIIKINNEQDLLQDSYIPSLSFESFNAEPKDYTIQYMEAVVRDYIMHAKQLEIVEEDNKLSFFQIPVYSNFFELPFKGHSYVTLSDNKNDSNNELYYTKISGLGSVESLLTDASRLQIVVYDKKNHHTLWFYPTSFITETPNNGSSIKISYKSIKVTDLPLARKLAKMIFHTDELKIDFAFKDTREYLNIDRNTFLVEKHDQLVDTVYRMLEAAVRQYQQFLVNKSFDQAAMFKPYNELNSELFTIIEQAYAQLENERDRNISQLEPYLNTLLHCLDINSEKLKELITEKLANLPSELIYIILTKRMYHWLHLAKNKLEPWFISIYDTESSIHLFFEKYSEVIFSLIGGDLTYAEFKSSYIDILHYMAGGSAIYPSQYIRRKQSSLKSNLKLFLQSTNAAKMFLYHVRFGHSISFSEDYLNILAALSDCYIHDDNYGHYSNYHQNESTAPLLFIKLESVIREAFFGTEVVLLRNQLCFPLDSEDQNIISFKPIQKLRVYSYNENDFYNYQTALHLLDTQAYGIELVGSANNYLFSEIIRWEYIDVEDRDWLPFNHEYYVLPALETYKGLAVKLTQAVDGEGINQQRDLRIIYSRSKFRFMKQEHYLVVPFTQTNIDNFIDLFKALSFELNRVEQSESRIEIRLIAEKCILNALLHDTGTPLDIYPSLSQLIAYQQQTFKSATFNKIVNFTAKYSIMRNEADETKHREHILLATKELARDILIYMFNNIVRL